MVLVPVWRKPGSNWTNTSADDNREDLRALASGGGPAPGLVALDDDGRAIGWVGLGPREAFGRLARSRTLPQLPGDDVWVINCFVVARGSRRSGVASCAPRSRHGVRPGARRGRPRGVSGRDRRLPHLVASVYTGTAAMFERAGFEVAAPSTSKAASGAPRVVVRREP